MSPRRRGSVPVAQRFVPLALLFLLAFAFLPVFQVHAQVSITGTSRQITTNSAGQFNPSISGNIVCYTDLRTGNANIFCYNLSTGIETQMTQASGLHIDELTDVSGTTVVYVDAATTNGNGDVDGSNIGGTAFNSFPIAADPSIEETNPGIGGLLVAWESRSTGNFEIHAQDLSTVTTKTIFASSSGSAHNAQVSGSLVTYWVQVSGSCQVYVTDYNTLTTTQLTSTTGCNQNPDISGSNVVYEADRTGSGNTQVFVYNLASNTEMQITTTGTNQNPHISGDWVIYQAVSSGASSVMLYNIPSGETFTAVPGTSSSCSASLSDIDGNNVAYTGNCSGINHIYVYSFTATTVQDFSFNSVSPITVSVGQSASGTVTVNSIGGFSSAVGLSVTTPPSGVSASLSPMSVTPSGGGSAASALTVSVSPFVTPQSFTLTITGTSTTPALTHSTTATVNVVATTSGVSSVVNGLLAAGCIDNAGIANALISKLQTAQSYIGAGQYSDAVNALNAFLNQVKAQSGKHILSSCTINGVTFNPATVLMTDAQSLINSLKVASTPNPITGYAVNSAGNGVQGATVSILDSSGQTVMTATTDITGFYFFSATNLLATGSTYTIEVIGFSSGFTTSTPSSQTFTWSGSALVISNFVLS